MLPVWQEAVRPYVESGELVVIGVVQEQHPARARLYCQWRQLDWPIFVDSLNLLDISVVPIPVAISAAGIVRYERIHPGRSLEEFVEHDAVGSMTPPADYNRATRPDVDRRLRIAKQSPSVHAWRDLGDAYFLSDGEAAAESRAVEAYRNAVESDPLDGRAQFRLGVALRRRYESPARRPGDAQSAVDRWVSSLALDPNQYIWRRRIQQYGPKLDKPYNFYFWVEQARREIRARGEQPVALPVEPSGSELAPPPGRGGGPAHTVERINKDPQGRVHRDTRGLVGIEPVLTPRRIRPGRRLRVQVTFRLNDKTRPLWNNEADGLRLWVDLPDGFTLDEGECHYPDPPDPETREVRRMEFEVQVPQGAHPGKVELPAYSLYYVCEEAGGKCLYLRQDLTLGFTVDPKALELQ